MQQTWEKYLEDPIIGPVLTEFRDSDARLRFLKRDLHTHSNPNAIIDESHTHTALTRRVKHLVTREEARALQRRYQWLGTALLFLTALVAGAGVYVLLGTL